MPITIETMTSNVKVIDREHALNDEVLETLVRAVLARLAERRDAEEGAREESEIPERASDSATF